MDFGPVPKKMPKLKIPCIYVARKKNKMNSDFQEAKSTIYRRKKKSCDIKISIVMMMLSKKIKIRE